MGKTGERNDARTTFSPDAIEVASFRVPKHYQKLPSPPRFDTTIRQTCEVSLRKILENRSKTQIYTYYRTSDGLNNMECGVLDHSFEEGRENPQLIRSVFANNTFA